MWVWRDSTIYPEPAGREVFGNCGGFVNAQLGNLVPLGSDLATVFITKREGLAKLYFLRLAPDCTVVSQQHLADMPAGEESQVVKIAPFRDWLIVAWRVAEAETKLAIVSPDGQLLAAPQSVAYALPAHDDMLVLPGGDVAWVMANQGESAVRLIRITAMKLQQ